MTFEQIIEKIRDKGEFKKEWAYYYLWQVMPDAEDGRIIATARQLVRQAG